MCFSSHSPMLNNIFLKLVTIVDPVSRWMFAEIIPVGCDNIAYFVANFMFKTFCCFGFPNVELFNVNSIQFEMVEQEYNQMISQANEMIPNLNLCPGEMTLKPNEDLQQSLDVSSHLLAPNQVSTSIWLLSLRQTASDYISMYRILGSSIYHQQHRSCIFCFKILISSPTSLQNFPQNPPPLGKVLKKEIIFPYFSLSEGENCP